MGLVCRDFTFLAFLLWLGMGELQKSLVLRTRHPPPCHRVIKVGKITKIT